MLSQTCDIDDVNYNLCLNIEGFNDTKPEVRFAHKGSQTREYQAKWFGINDVET